MITDRSAADDGDRTHCAADYWRTRTVLEYTRFTIWTVLQIIWEFMRAS